MLKVFRDNLKYLSWVLWLVILVFIIFIFADFGGIDLGAGAAATGAAAAVVGGDEVSYVEFERAYRQVESQYREAYGQQFNRELANQIGLPLQVLNQLVDERILLEEAERIGLEVTDEELRRSIVEFDVFRQDGAFIGQEAYAALLRRNGLRPEEFESSQRRELLTQKVREALSRTVYVAPAEVEEAYREESETASIRLLRVPVGRFAGEVEVDEEGLTEYFEEHLDDFRLSERRVVDYLLVDSAALQATLEISEEEARAYYDANVEDFTTDEQVKARHILLRTGEERSVEAARDEIEAIKARIEGGEDFAALAAELSDDPGSKTRGGDLGFFPRGAMVESFEDAAFGAELGELVGPVESSFGVHLIQVQAKRPGGPQPFEEVEPGIRARLAGESAESQAERKAATLAQAVAESQSDLAGLEALAAAETGVTAGTTEPFGREDNVAGIGRGTDFTTQAFELAVGEVSGAVRLPRGWAVLVLREVQEPRLPDLAEVRERVESEYRRQLQRELARGRLAEARAAIAEGATLESVAEELDVTVEDAGPFGAHGAVGSLGEETRVARRALELEAGAVSEPMVLDDEVVLFEVGERTHFDAVMFASEQKQVRERLERERFGELMRGFLERRREELDVTIDPRVFEAFSPDPQRAS